MDDGTEQSVSVPNSPRRRYTTRRDRDRAFVLWGTVAGRNCSAVARLLDLPEESGSRLVRLWAKRDRWHERFTTELMLSLPGAAQEIPGLVTVGIWSGTQYLASVARGEIAGTTTQDRINAHRALVETARTLGLTPTTAPAHGPAITRDLRSLSDEELLALEEGT